MSDKIITQTQITLTQEELMMIEGGLQSFSFPSTSINPSIGWTSSPC